MFCNLFSDQQVWLYIEKSNVVIIQMYFLSLCQKSLLIYVVVDMLVKPQHDFGQCGSVVYVILLFFNTHSRGKMEILYVEICLYDFF